MKHKWKWHYTRSDREEGYNQCERCGQTWNGPVPPEKGCKPEHEASDPIKTPVRYVNDPTGAYLVDADGQDLDDIDWSAEERRTVGQHIAKCINERPQLLAETLRLREENEKLSAARKICTECGKQIDRELARWRKC